MSEDLAGLPPLRKRALLVLTFAIALPLLSGVRAQTARDSARSMPGDSLRPSADTLHHFPLQLLAGTLDWNLPERWKLSAEELSWRGERSLGEVLGQLPGFGLLDQSSEGGYSALFVRGADWRAIAFSLDGRPLNDPISGIFNPYHAQTEDDQTIEVVSGPRAFLYGLNSQGAVVNFVTHDFSTNKPYTKIVYEEGPYNLSHTDGTFSQNVSRRVNVTAGFQHLGTDGRYPNSADDQWQVRGRLRVFLAERFALTLSEEYLSTLTDLNGGINLAASGSSGAFSQASAVMVNTDAYEKLSRHDLDLTLSGRILDDTSSVTRVTLYYSTLLREYRDEENRPYSNGVFIQADHRSSWMGVRLSQGLALGPFILSIGGEAENLQVERSPNLGSMRKFRQALWGKAEVPLSRLDLAFYARADELSGNSGTGIGADATLEITPELSLFGGASRSERLPDLFELAWDDSTVSRTSVPTPERHLQLEAGAEFRFSGHGELRLSLFHRTIENPIFLLPYRPGEFVFPGLSIAQWGKTNTSGLEAGASLQIWRLLLEGTGTSLLKQSGEPGSLYPRLALDGGVYLHSDFFQDHLGLKAGFRGKFVSSFAGSLFNPEALALVANPGVAMGSFSTVDFVLIARIGDAKIHFIWENLTGTTAFTAPYYAVPDRGIRFGIAWEFMN